MCSTNIYLLNVFVFICLYAKSITYLLKFIFPKTFEMFCSSRSSKIDVYETEKLKNANRT